LRRITSWNETLSKGLASIPGIEVHFITATKLIRKTRTLSRNSLSVTFLVTPWKANFFTGFQYTRWAVHRMLQKIKPDLVHGIGTEHIWPYIAVTSSFPSVVTVHGVVSEIVRKVPPPFFSQKRLFAWLERWVMLRTKHLIAISPYVERTLGSCTSASIYYVENPVSEVFFQSKSKPEMGECILFVGSIERRKGLDVLIDAFGRLHRGKVATAQELVIVGPTVEQAYADSLRPRIETFGLGRKIRFSGFLFPDALTKIYSRASFLVLPSIEETSPMCVAEAMAAGLPIVATKAGGTPSMVEDGMNGFLVEPGDAHGLAKRMETLLNSPELRVRMGRRSRDIAIQRWQPAHVAEKTVQVYQKILESKEHENLA